MDVRRRALLPGSDCMMVGGLSTHSRADKGLQPCHLYPLVSPAWSKYRWILGRERSIRNSTSLVRKSIFSVVDLHYLHFRLRIVVLSALGQHWICFHLPATELHLGCLLYLAGEPLGHLLLDSRESPYWFPWKHLLGSIQARGRSLTRQSGHFQGWVVNAGGEKVSSGIEWDQFQGQGKDCWGRAGDKWGRDFLTSAVLPI